MEAIKIIKIINKYKSNELNEIEASLLLVILGLKSDEIKSLLHDS